MLHPSSTVFWKLPCKNDAKSSLKVSRSSSVETSGLRYFLLRGFICFLTTAVYHRYDMHFLFIGASLKAISSHPHRSPHRSHWNADGNAIFICFNFIYVIFTPPRSRVTHAFTWTSQAPVSQRFEMTNSTSLLFVEPSYYLLHCDCFDGLCFWRKWPLSSKLVC